MASAPFFKSQICIDPLGIDNNGTGLEERLFPAQNHLADGSEFVYSYEWGFGDPTSANFSHRTFAAWVCFYRTKPSITRPRTTYSPYEGNADNYLTCDPAHGFFWKGSGHAEDFVIKTRTEK
jgi:hypothetical protein